MRLLERYAKEFGESYHEWEIERAGFLWFSLGFGLVYLVSRSIRWALIFGFLFVWGITPPRPTMALSRDARELRITNPTCNVGFPKMLLPRYVMSVVYRIISPGEKSYADVKRVSGAILNMSSPRVVLRVYQPEVPRVRRQIIITNHTHTPIRDAFSFFAFSPPDSELIVVQHNFHWFVTAVARRLYGAWTIDKDDKSKTGKRNMVTQLTSLLMHMRSKSDCSVVIYPAGRVPKTPDEEIGPFYPGAFYLALMSGYLITPLVNRYTQEGEFSTTLHPPIDVLSEYRQRIIPESTIEKFRISNVDILNEMCERFRKYFLVGGYNIEHADKVVDPPLHGGDVGTRMDDGPLA